MTVSTRGKGRTGKTKAQLDVELRDREALAVRLRREGNDYATIAESCGWNTEDAARKAVQRALDRREEADVNGLRQMESAKLDAYEVELLRILAKRHVLVHWGKVVHLPDEHGELQPVEDDAPKMAAIRELVRIADRRSKLRGLDAPMRKIVEVITDDAVQAEIRRLNLMIEELDDIPTAT